MITRLFLLASLLAPLWAHGATWYIDNRLTTGSNNGTSPSNAWRSLYDSAYGASAGSVAAGDRIKIVDGSGPYYEATNSIAAKRVRAADISFSAATKTIHTNGAVSFASYTAGTGYIRVAGSASNDGQYQVATVSATDITLAASHTLVDEAFGASIRITDITPTGSTLFVFDQGRNGAAGNPVVWELGKAEISAGLNLAALTYTWTLSRSGTNEWFVRRADGSNPGLIKPDSAAIDGNSVIASAGDADHRRGTVGALSFVGQFGYGDNDSLGYNTVYVRTAGTPPRDVQVGQIPYVLWSNWGNHTFLGGVWSFGNGTANGAVDGATIQCRGANLTWIGPFIRWADGHGFEANSSGPCTLSSYICYWAGHRCGYLTGNITFNMYSGIDWGSHLGLLISATSTGTVNLYNSIFANEEAGAIDKKSASATLNEGYNLFYPRMTAAGGALGYVSTANWATTAATDIPPSTATTLSDQSLLSNPRFMGGSAPAIPDDFRLMPNGPGVRKGVCYQATGCDFYDFAGIRGFVPPDQGAFQNN